LQKSKLKPAIPQLPTGNLEITARFFEQQLGFDIEAIYPKQGFLIVCRGKAEIHFWLAESDTQAKEVAGMSSCYIRVKNIEELFSEFENRGVNFRYKLTLQPWGMYEMQIDDPFGNAIRFGENHSLAVGQS